MAKGDKHSLEFDFLGEASEAPKSSVPPSFAASAPASTVSSQPSAATPLPPAEPAKEALTVAELNHVLRDLIEKPFGFGIFVEGEVSQPKMAPRGHLYFTLKDETEDASIDCVVYKTNLTPMMRKRLAEGDRVRLRGKPNYWPVRGRLQFVADRAEATGKGALLEALEKLKEKLAAEGLFTRKRPIPTHPRIIGVVTSRTGAVVHDIRKVAFRRGGANILVAPATVQGANAAASVRAALAELSRVKDVDVIVLARGGGSLEDLMCFNDEALVRAVAASPIPIVSAIGHETDVTLCDFAADARAATPSQAAEMVVPDRAALASRLLEQRARLARATLESMSRRRRGLDLATRRLGDPRLLLAGHQAKVDDLGARLRAAMQSDGSASRKQLASLRERLLARHPGRVLSLQRRSVEQSARRIQAATVRLLAQYRQRLGAYSASLDALSPLRVLGRGYALVTTAKGKVVRSPADVADQEPISIRLAEGTLSAQVHGKDT